MKLKQDVTDDKIKKKYGDIKMQENIKRKMKRDERIERYMQKEIKRKK